MTASMAARLDEGTLTIIPLAWEASTQVSWRENVVLDGRVTSRNVGFTVGPFGVTFPTGAFELNHRAIPKFEPFPAALLADLLR
jgi:hypothetical protein